MMTDPKRDLLRRNWFDVCLGLHGLYCCRS